MSCDSPMTLLGTFSGRKFYLAEEGRFTRPGIYFWDGKNNVHVDDAITRPTPEGADVEPNIGAPTAEPSLRNILRAYYAQVFGPDEANDLADKYIAALSLSGKQGEAAQAAPVPSGDPVLALHDDWVDQNRRALSIRGMDYADGAKDVVRFISQKLHPAPVSTAPDQSAEETA